MSSSKSVLRPKQTNTICRRHVTYFFFVLVGAVLDGDFLMPEDTGRSSPDFCTTLVSAGCGTGPPRLIALFSVAALSSFDRFFSSIDTE